MADPKHGAITDEAALMVVQANPGLNDHQIGKKLVEMGVVEAPNIIYKRYKKNDYLAKDIAEIRAHSREANSREAVPLAHKITVSALKSRKLSPKEKVPFIQIANKIEYGEDRGPTAGIGKVQIGQLQIYQQVIQDNLDK